MRMVRPFMPGPMPIREQKVNFGASPGGEGGNESEHATKVVGMAVGAFERKVGGVTQSVGASGAGRKPRPGTEKETGAGGGKGKGSAPSDPAKTSDNE